MSELYVGLISGTSIDGIDAALLDLQSTTPRLIATHSEAIPRLKTAIAALCSPDDTLGGNAIDTLGQLHIQLGMLFAQAANNLLTTAGISAQDVTAIGSHGQTVRHRPPLSSVSLDRSAQNTSNTTTNFPQGFTLQIADPSVMAEQTGITTIADFRSRDMAAGGQGAPLAPAFHAAIAPHDTKTCAFLNLGGIANITLIHRGELICGFDSGPANGLMDAWIQQHRQQPHDTNGDWARAGAVNQALLKQMLSYRYFPLQAPKSTGREEFNRQWLNHYIECLETQPDPIDVQATLAELTVQSISDAIKQLPHQPSTVYCCGGGVHNTYLMEKLKSNHGAMVFDATETLGIPGDWIEASTFAWLAKQTLSRQPIKLNGITGAKGNRILGAIYPP